MLVNLHSNKEIIEKIKINGCFDTNEVLQIAWITRIKEECLISMNKVPLNSCGNHGVDANFQRFLPQVISTSRSFVKLVINDKVQNLLNTALNKNYIVASRYYETGPNGVNMWHDDQTYVNKEYADSPPMSLVFIIYLSDVMDYDHGPFQYINKSHLNYNKSKKGDYTSTEVVDGLQKDVVTVFGKSGTLIIFDARTLHRAKPHKQNNIRSSLFFQVSKYIEDASNFKEKILLDPSYLSESEFNKNNLFDFFGFNVENTENVYPETDASWVPPRRLFVYLKIISKQLSIKLLKSIFEMLPIKLKIKIRQKTNMKYVDYYSLIQ